jgi:hypothetical protein
MRLRGILVLALSLAAGLAAAVPAAADNNTRPDALQQPLKDGCQRNPAGLLTFSSPEWVYVYGGDPEVRTLEGTAHVASPAGEDLPENHLSYDMDANVSPDGPYQYLLGGDPNAKNGNFALGDGGKPGEDTNRVHVEWESKVLPQWAWPTEGDRVKIVGPWIWDCGHWGEGISDPDYFLPGSGPFTKGQLRGEQTEIHPMQALFLTRAKSIEALVPETQTDAFISSEGTAARGEEECTKKFPAPQVPPGVPPPSYGPQWTACVTTTTHQVVNDRSYSFFVPAPAAPSRNATLRYRIVRHGADQGGPQENVEVRKDGIAVTVSFRDKSATNAMSYGRSFFVGWEAEKRSTSHLLLDLRTLTVDHSLDPNPGGNPQSSPPPGEYNVYLDAGGKWLLLNDIAPGLGAVFDGMSFDLKRTLDLFVQPGASLRLSLRSRECDLPRMYPCDLTGEVSSGNDHPGDLALTFGSASAALGEHVARPDGGNYSLTYAVRRGPEVNSPGGPCYDVFAPRSSITRKGKRRSRIRGRRVVLRGTASDRGCGPVRGRIRRTQVSMSRRAGKRCRFLGRGGLSRPRSCKRPLWLRTRGTRSWRRSVRARHALPAGRYRIEVRSIDRAGNVEHKRTKANSPLVKVKR